jgi:hypothetical protein
MDMAGILIFPVRMYAFNLPFLSCHLFWRENSALAMADIVHFHKPETMA